jgi:ribose-phosphate pyrophosphokinase
MNAKDLSNRLVFSLEPHPLQQSLCEAIDAQLGTFETRLFPDGESYLRLEQDVRNKRCIVLVDLSHPNKKYLPLIFLLDTLRELGASSIGLVAPYLSYMRQDRRFVEGEAITSKLFASALSRHIDWLVTVDPHLHRYHALDEIYSVPSRVVQGAPALADWLKDQNDLLLVGPDAESEQWVSEIAAQSGHPFVIGEKKRYGDRHVEVTLPDISAFENATAVIIDDVISSGQTIMQCVQSLKQLNIHSIQCAAIHGIFADKSDKALLESGLQSLVTSNTIPHKTNTFDVTGLLVNPILDCLEIVTPKAHSCCGGKSTVQEKQKSCCQKTSEIQS